MAIVISLCYLTFDLEWWPWPWHVTYQNVQLNEIHMHAKYKFIISNSLKVFGNCYFCVIWPLTLNGDLDLDMWPIKLCSSMRYICMPSMNSLSVVVQKLLPMLKFDTNKPTNQQTNKQTDRAKTICPPITDLGGIKMVPP